MTQKTAKEPLLTEKAEKPQEKSQEKEKFPVVSFTTLLRFADAKDKLLMTIGTFAAMANGAALPIMTIFFGDIIQAYGNYYNDQDQTKLNDSVTEAVYILVGLGFAMWILSYTQMCFWMWAGANQGKRIRENFFRSVLRQDIGWFDHMETGDLTSRLIADVSIIQDGISEKVSLVIQFYTTFFAGFIVGFVRGWELTLLLMGIFPLLGGAAAVLSQIIAQDSNEGQGAYAAANGIAQQVFGSIKTVMAFNGQESEKKRYGSKLIDAEKAGVKKSIFTALGLGITMFLVFATYSLAFWFGNLLINWNRANSGEVLNVFFSVIIGIFSLGNASPNQVSIQKAQGVASKIFDIIQRPSVIDPLSENGKKLDKTQGSIEFNQVSFHYPQRPDVTVLKSFSLQVKSGQSVALVGASGSGKSTIVKLLERFYDPVQGSITLDGHPIQDLNVHWLRSIIGIVSQEPCLFNTTIRENILYGYPGDFSKLTKEEQDDLIKQACTIANAWEFIQKLPNGLDTNVGEAGSMMSGGQKQRIAIARAILKNPPILLLDEATSALDTESERIVQAALDEAAKGRTTITIAHRLSTIKNSSMIVVMKEGDIIETGTHEQLVAKNGAYAGLVRAQELAQITPSDAKAARPEIISSGSPTTPKTVADVMKTVAKDTDENDKDKPATPSKSVGLLRILKYNKPEWYMFLFGGLASVLNGITMPLFAIVFAEILTVFNNPDSDQRNREANMWALYFLLLAIAAFIANFFQLSLTAIAGEKLTTRIRQKCFNSILRQDMPFFDKPENAPGILVARLADDATQVQGLTGQFGGSIISVMSTLTAGLLIAFVNEWRMTLISLTLLPFTIVGGALQMKVLQGFGGKSKKAFNEAGQVACEAILNIRTVATLNREEYFYQQYATNIIHPYRITLKGAYLSSIGFGFSNGILFFAYALSFYYGSRVLIWEPPSADVMSRVLTVVFAIIFTAMAAGQASSFAPNVAKAKVAAASVFELIDAEPSIDVMSDQGQKKDHSDVKGSADIKSAQFIYPSRPDTQVLHGMTITAKPGQTVALVGPSGCGKSTVIGLLERFYDVSGGESIFEDINVKEWNPKNLRSHMSLVGQEPVLFNVSIKDNILYGAVDGKATNEEIEAVARMANIHDFVMSLPEGYDTLVGERGGQLSGGQKQRIAIARALISNPKLLLLDEATSALDSESEKVVQAALDAASKARTTLVIAHRLSTIQKADVIYVVQGGVITEQGTHSELLSRRGFYYELVNQQSLGAHAA